MSSLDALFAPASVAVVGDSPTGGRGAMMRAHLERLGYAGPIYPVNPKYQEIRGRRCYPSLSEIGEPVDAVLLAVSAPRAVTMLREAAGLGARAAVVIASGFAEAGAEGKRLQDELTRVAHDNGIALCGPNCYGAISFVDGFAGYGGPVPHSIGTGDVAMLLQSGALSHAVLNPAGPRGLGLSHLVTTGNEAVVKLGAYVRHVVDDPRTRVIACFIEGLRDPEVFTDAVLAARAAGKPVVVCKTGRSERAKAAAVAHTGAIAGNDAAFDALCRAAGVIRVDDLDQMIEACLLLSSGQTIEPPFAFASISGGGSGVMADLAAAEGLELAQFSDATADRLREVLPSFANVNNPLDLTGAVGEQPELVTAALRVLDDAAEVGTVGFAINASCADDEFESRMYARMLGDAAAGATSTPMVGFTMTSGGMDSSVLATANQAKIPLLMGMRESIAVLARVARARRHRRQWHRPDRPPVSPRRPKTLSEGRSSALLAEAGLRLPAHEIVDGVADAVDAAQRIGYPVVVKAESPDIPHKTEAGCVALGLGDAEQVRLAAERVLEAGRRAAPDSTVRLLVSEMVPDGVDLLVGAVAEPGIGHLVVVGLGGVLTEVLSASTQRILAPVTQAEAEEMLADGVLGRMLAGYRGAPAADRTAAAQAIVAVSRFLVDHPEVHELDINPLRVLPEGHGVRLLDALIVADGDAPWASDDP